MTAQRPILFTAFLLLTALASLPARGQSASLYGETLKTSCPLNCRDVTSKKPIGSYIDTLTDRAIGDVLRKMPGIDVSESGQIRYNNRPINKFYIEGLDLMGGRYGVAVNNVRARDISRVEVLENHQPIKALKDVEFSPDAAINLRLKDGAKGSLIATLSLGGGYKPWMWNGELALMLFTGNYQMMTTVKSNNSGDDVTTELTLFYDSFQKEYSPLSVHLPALPDTDRERYMDNLTHAVSINNIVRLGDSTDNDNTLNINAIYLHDRQRYNSSSLTTYYLPDGQPPLEIDETTSATELSDGTEFKLRYNLNNEKIYLNEQIAFGAEWNRNSGSVLSDGITGEHYLNDAISGGSRNIFFLDASISYKARKFEYILEGRNLLGTGTYNQRTYSDITNFQYLYRLRPLSVMFKIRFSLG